MKDYTALEVILDNQPEGSGRLEIHSGIITGCNETFAKSVGYSKEELIGQPFDLFRTDITKKLQTCKVLVNTENELELQNQELRRVGEELRLYQIDLELQNYALRATKESLHLSKSKMQSIFDNSSESVLFIDPERKIQLFNEIAFTRASVIFGKEINIGSSIYEVILPQYKDNFERNFLAALNGKRTVSDVSFLVNNQDYWFEFQYAPVRNEKNEILGVLLSARDINEKKIIEFEMKTQIQELEILNQIKDKFFNIIAQDLRNPFFGIIGLTEILEAKLIQENKKDELELLYPIQMMHTSSKFAYSLLENLIQWAKMKTGKIVVERKNTLLKSIISDSISHIEFMAINKNITIEINIVDDHIVYADNVLVISILRNLLTNAIKFTHRNGIIKVSASSKESFLEISITDNGIGIDPVSLEKIFQIDSNFNKLGTEKEKGSGLGLILCKEFLDKLGGKIKAESILGKGSTFTFSLPLAKKAF